MSACNNCKKKKKGIQIQVHKNTSTNRLLHDGSTQTGLTCLRRHRDIVFKSDIMQVFPLFNVFPVGSSYFLHPQMHFDGIAIVMWEHTGCPRPHYIYIYKREHTGCPRRHYIYSCSPGWKTHKKTQHRTQWYSTTLPNILPKYNQLVS